MKLVIVESPAKSKTITSYLGKDYVVESSIGHIRDLKIKGKGGFGVDIENHFQPEYEILKDKVEVVAKLKELASQANHIFLATDPDREGEAISWHLQEVLEQSPRKVSRIVFNEITKTAVTRAIENDRQVDMDLVHSQESRRILDRIIGFRLSSLLQQKLGSKSAGRVQSVALKMIVDREKEIENFKIEEYYEVEATFKKDDKIFKALLNGNQDGKIDIKTKDECDFIINSLNDEFVIDDIQVKNRQRSSKPPFITSTLQQDANAKYNYNAKRVMAIAQRLYEGIDLGDERVGLITYMRTDSTRLSDEFVTTAKNAIIARYGDKYYSSPKKVKKGPNIQDAHEAIRPTHIEYTPDKIKKYLSLEEFKIYSLIYNRAMASLMSSAIMEDTKIKINNNGYFFQATGSKVIYDGYLRIYQESFTDENNDETNLPLLKIGETLTLEKIEGIQKFTTPPSRYNEARLIKRMEECGIGRPSTYALTMETLRLRNYAKMEGKMFVPTDQGRLTDEQLQLFFSSIINIKYTANMEQKLDEIADGNLVWYEVLQEFYDDFVPLIENARDNMVKIYPKLTDEFCPVCGLPLYIRNGPFGEFTACSGYPHCKFIKKKEKVEVKTGVICPVCGEGEIVERISGRGRDKGKKFYACNRYPSCKATFSGVPTGNKCEKCGAFMINVDGKEICANQHCETNKK